MTERKKILITGSCGFIFSNFVRMALKESWPYQIVSIDKVSRPENIYNVYANRSHKFYLGDITDKHLINTIFELEKPDIVLHGAAESNVNDSIAEANPFIMSNVLGTQNLLDASVKHDVKRFCYVSCYDSNTRAVTKSGLKHWYDLKDGDFVLSINPDSGIIEEKKINKIIVQDYAGKMLHFKNRRLDFCVTPNHRCIYTDHQTSLNGNLNWSEADVLFDKTNKYLPTGKVLDKKNIHNIWIKDLGIVDVAALFYVCGVFIADGFTAYQKKKTKSITGLNKEDYKSKFRDPKTGRFVKGYKVGNIDYVVSNSYRVFFDVPENDKARERLESSLNKLGISYHTHKNKSGEHIYFSSKEWVTFFEQFGHLAKNKKIPEWMFDYDYSVLKSLWDGIHDGDGHGNNIPGRTVRITTVSDKLASQLSYLGFCIGFTARIGKQYSISFLEGRKIEGEANVVYFSQKRRPKIPKPIEIDYNGKIWCLSVEDNKNFLVERNGLITFSGNTDEVFGHLENEDDKSWTEESLLNPRNPYSASKAAGELLVKAANVTYGLPFNITRTCNNFGPKQSVKNLIPKTIYSILEKNKIPIYGQGKQIREWIHVADNCEAIRTVLEKGRINEIYNIGTGFETSNLELVNDICNIMNEGYDLISFIKDPRPGHDFRYSLDSSKIRSLGWKPKFRFKDGLKHTIKWYLNNQNWFCRNTHKNI